MCVLTNKGINFQPSNIFRALKIRIIEYDGRGFVDSERNQHEDYIVSRFVTHPDFNKKRLSDDIALLELKEPIDLIQNEGVNAACLPACNNMFHHTFANNTGVRCWVAGHGADKKGGRNSGILTKVCF